MNVKLVRARGRPRSVEAQEAILKAAADLIATGGIGAVSIEAVARLAGVGKPTIYRNWDSKESLAMAALLRSGVPDTQVKQSDSALSDLYMQLAKVAAAFNTTLGRHTALMVASSDADSEIAKAFRNQIMQGSREEGRTILKRAIAEGAIDGRLDLDVALDMIYGPIFYRLLMGHVPANREFSQTLLDTLMQGFSPAPSKRTGR